MGASSPLSCWIRTGAPKQVPSHASVARRGPGPRQWPDARGRREEDYSESHSRTGPRVSSLSGFLVGFRVVPVSGLLRLPTLVLDVFILN